MKEFTKNELNVLAIKTLKKNGIKSPYYDVIPFLKKEGVKEVLKYFNIDREFSLAIGDDTNDIDMFNETKFSICVGNGKEELKKHATFISKDIKDNGIFDILKELKII